MKRKVFATLLTPVFIAVMCVIVGVFIYVMYLITEVLKLITVPDIAGVILGIVLVVFLIAGSWQFMYESLWRVK